MSDCGIYKITLGTDKVYIGQSSNLSVRKYAHKSLLKRNKHYNLLMQIDYNLTNTFNFEILLLCNISELDSNEISFIEKYNSLNSGYNLVSGGPSGRGLEHNSSVYSKEQIIETFFLCLDVNKTYKEISSITGVSESSVRHISGREVHSWLDELFPNESKQLLNLKTQNLRNASARKLDKYKYTILKHKSGIIEGPITNISTFSRKYNVNSAKIGAVMLGNRNMHKDWRGLE